MNRPYRKWRDLLVGSDEHRLMTHPSSSGTTSVPLRINSGGTCLSRPPPGGTRLSGPLFDVGSSIPFHRGLKSRVKSGAKAPHSMECGDSSPLFGEGFSLHHLGAADVLPRIRKRFPGRGNSLIAPTAHWRALPVRPDAQRLMPHPLSPGTTSVPLRINSGGTCLSRPPPGRTFSGGTRLSGPLFDAGSSIPFHRGLKSRAESGAKAPHSMECGDLSPLFSEGFSLHQPWR
ncbi:hypothetical protein THTE_0365 [Thermogutta terrifontis]|uniref:Uncharacterized protein n=1 Tax=Thermogutta terrifontis TaxID=1331910 RepID=A0A286RAJ2_9BACT|nr:hypothetical protein THTE_0365 [Thermogutta terrifontis]